MADEEAPVKRGRGRPRTLPPPEDRYGVRLDLTGAELQRLREAVERLRQAGEPGASQAVLARRALLAEVDRILRAGGPRANGRPPKAAPPAGPRRRRKEG
jgi:hypothetical protein